MLGNFAPMRVCFVLCGGRQRGRGRETGAPPTGRDSKKKKKKKSPTESNITCAEETLACLPSTSPVAFEYTHPARCYFTRSVSRKEILKCPLGVYCHRTEIQEGRRRRRRRRRKGRPNLSLCGCGGGRDLFSFFGAQSNNGLRFQREVTPGAVRSSHAGL